MSEVLGRELAQPRAPQVASPIRVSQGHHSVPDTRLRWSIPGPKPLGAVSFLRADPIMSGRGYTRTRLLWPSWETGWLLCPFLWWVITQFQPGDSRLGPHHLLALRGNRGSPGFSTALSAHSAASQPLVSSSFSSMSFSFVLETLRQWSPFEWWLTQTERLWEHSGHSLPGRGGLRAFRLEDEERHDWQLCTQHSLNALWNFSLPR